MTGMPWLPYENEDLCVGSIQYSYCSLCGLMLTHAAQYLQQGEPLCQSCYEIVTGSSEQAGKNS
jgi:hypothetical protein